MESTELGALRASLAETQKALAAFFRREGPDAGNPRQLVQLWGAFTFEIEGDLTNLEMYIPSEDAQEIVNHLSLIRAAAADVPSGSMEESQAYQALGQLIQLVQKKWNITSTAAKARLSQTLKLEEETQGLRYRLAQQISDLESAQVDLAKFLSQAKLEISLLKSELAKSSTDFAATIDRYLAQEPRLNDVLGKSSKVGLSGAFSARARRLSLAKFGWVLLLGASLVAMYCTGNSLISALQAEVKWPQLLVRSLLSLPLVWAAWFAARQYGYASRLQEDYEFKVASATSYEAYKKEATQINEEMKIKLMESAIQTFSENPLRIYNIPSDPGTPLQEVMESFSKLDKVIDATAKWRKPAPAAD
ncbi:hypothetical protein [Variovorax sp. EBFNA2]|uniref:hypothetical protein n=1 Tax=Variovorax sp. EBFNA2 TaxID=3342097 RepID=UPI0029BFAC71|nr:hypothetical protein [Variovorax boronicumulans]WPG35120.1 hypothetical protein RZE79_16645 [Variovorax boronicumulans]